MKTLLLLPIAVAMTARALACGDYAALHHLSEDTCRNEYLLHPKIHAWLATGELANVDALYRKVYAELFLNPDSDPWLGLVSPDTFTALENNGVAHVNGDNSKTATSTPIGL
jgi:hypothetical protein